MTQPLRERATAVLIRDDRVLLVQDRGDRHFQMPGGGVERGETPSSAVTRELLEETGLKADRTEHLFVWESSTIRHTVFRVESDGDVKIGNEIGAFLWWDQKEALPTLPHVEAIMKRL